MTKYLKLLSILILICSSSCKKYEKRYVIDPKEVSEKLKLESKLIEYDKNENFGAYTSYKINSLENFYIKTPKPFKKDFKHKYALEKVFGVIKDNNYNPIITAVQVAITPIALLFDTISFVLTQDGPNKDPHTSKSTFFEPNTSRYNYCSEITVGKQKHINLELLSNFKLLDKKSINYETIIHITSNQNKIYNTFNSKITPDYRKLNKIGVNLRNEVVKLTLNKKNIKVLNNIIIKTYSDLRNLCKKNIKDEVHNLFTTKENHLILKYGFNTDDLIEHKLKNNNKIFIINPKIADSKQSIKYQLYYIDKDNISKNLHSILNRMDNLKSIKLKLSKKNKKVFKTSPTIHIYNNYNSSIAESLKKEFKDNRIYNAIYNVISKKIEGDVFYNNNRRYIVLPKNKRKITIQIPYSNFYYFEKAINLKQNQRTIEINNIIEKSDYEYLINKLKKKVSKKPTILIGDADSEVAINSRKVVSRYCDGKSGEIDKKYYSSLTYHKEPKVRKDLSYELDKLMNAGYRYKNSFKIYCDIKAEDHYPFKGLVTIDNATYYKQKNIIFYLPHILSKSKKRPHYIVR